MDENDNLPDKEQGGSSASEEQADVSPDAEDKSSISADLIRGHINTIILRALYERDKYGYEIINDIERKSHNQYSLKQPTLYSALKRLENQGYIIAYWKSDEVSSGGRRKYFTLTDSGREITERNLAEWEYSRTIIDNLISDRSFDFSQPAPTPVDFTILRNSVSRVPIVRNDDDDEEDNTEALPANNNEQVNDTLNSSDVQHAETENEHVDERSDVQQQYTQTYSDQSIEQHNITQAVEEQSTIAQVVEEQPVVRQINDSAESERRAPVPLQVSEEETAARRRAHENYLRLISEPIVENKPPEDIVPNSSQVNTRNLLYNVKPNTERDYKNLINGIYDKALSNGTVDTYYGHSESANYATQRKVSTSTNEIISRGKADGVRITPSYEYDTHNNYATKTTYNKGLTLLMCSGIVLFILLVEFIFCMIFKDKLQVTVAYPVVILLLGIIQFAVFGFLMLKGYGANCAKPLSNSYLTKSIIFTLILILIICVSSFLFNINFTLASDVFKLIIIPSITVLNIVVFAVSFYFIVK